MFNDYQEAVPFLLGGNIGPDDADVLARYRHSLFAGLSLDRQFETAPAIKDVGLLRHFIDTLHNN